MNARASLLARIYTATAVAVTVLFAAAGWFFVYEASSALHAGVEREVRASLATVDAALESRTEHLASASALMASMSDIRAAFGTKDQATMRDSAAEFWARAQADQHDWEPAVFVVAGPDGEVLTAVDGKPPSELETGSRLPSSLLEPARRVFPRQARAFARWDGTVWQVLATPVYVDSGRRSALLDILVAAHPLTNSTLQELKDRTGGIDFVLRAGDGTLATVTPEVTQSISSHPERFAIHSTVLRDGDGRVLADLLAVRSYQDVAARISALTRITVIAWFAAMTAGLCLSYALARRVVRPVGVLNDAAQQISRENYSVRVPETWKGEFGVLARTFNRMSESIETSRDEKVRDGQIAAVGRLAASIAHDLRNPLSAVVGGAEMLAEFELPPDQIRQTAAHVHRAALRMERLLAEVGQVALAKAGRREQCQVRDLIAAAADSQTDRAAERKVEIKQQIEGNAAVLCERSRLERVLVNLIGNALEAMPGGGEVSIRAWEADGMAWIEVSDTGPGVPEEIRKRLFQPFVTAGKKDGLGLGLALARQTAREHGGELKLAPSEHGASFQLCLPTQAGQERLPTALHSRDAT